MSGRIKGEDIMRIGYPCINRTLDCSSARTFRLASFTEDRFLKTVHDNLQCLERIIDFNIEKGMLFFRITSDLIPFASHEICKVNWESIFSGRFQELGEKIRSGVMRVSMHPDQFVLLNSPRNDVVENSIRELEYHAKLLDLMELDLTAKIQIHVGGVYENKQAALQRFCESFNNLSQSVKRRLVIENDERLYSLQDCMTLNSIAGVPILLDSFHHSILNNGESLSEALKIASSTWDNIDGLPMVDYSSQEPGGRKGKHTETINLEDFNRFLGETESFDFDLMLEIKDKEASAMKAIEAACSDRRLIKAHSHDRL